MIKLRFLFFTLNCFIILNSNISLGNDYAEINLSKEKLKYLKSLSYNNYIKEIYNKNNLYFNQSYQILPIYILHKNINESYLKFKIDNLNNINESENFELYKNLYLYEYYKIKGLNKYSDFYYNLINKKPKLNSFEQINILITQIKLNNLAESDLTESIDKYINCINQLNKNSYDYKFSEFCLYYYNILYNLNIDYNFKYKEDFKNYLVIKKLKEFKNKNEIIANNDNIFILNYIFSTDYLIKIKNSDALGEYIKRLDSIIKKHNIFPKENINLLNSMILNNKFLLNENKIQYIYRKNIKTIDSIDVLENKTDNLKKIENLYENVNVTKNKFNINIIILCFLIFLNSFFYYNRIIYFFKSNYVNNAIYKTNIDKKNIILNNNNNIDSDTTYKTEEKFKNLEHKLDTWIIEKKFLTNVSSHDLAKELGTNIVYLNNYITLKHNTTFKNYINYLRIEEAKKIILNDKNRIYSIEGIAKMIGYNSINSFKTNFQKFNNTTLSEFYNSLNT
jgi:AraC-like DNA-binding protein